MTSKCPTETRIIAERAKRAYDNFFCAMFFCFFFQKKKTEENIKVRFYKLVRVDFLIYSEYIVHSYDGATSSVATEQER